MPMNDLHSQRSLEFRRRFRKRELLLGTFIKSAGPTSVEIAGNVGFDFVLIDAEHAPFDRMSQEMAILAARATHVASLVRVPSAAPEVLLAALDDGATGVVVPHVRTAEVATQVVAACRYSMSRGFSNSPRAGQYGGRGFWEHVDAADREVTLIAMIEDPEAVENIEAILAVAGLDGVFIGRGDLAVALNDREAGFPKVTAATSRILQACNEASKPACLLASNGAEAEALQCAGASAFVISSDQGFMKAAATNALSLFKTALTPAQVAS